MSLDLKKLLVPTDFSPASEDALRYAIDLAEELKAEVDVVHAYQIPVYAMPDGAVIARPDYLTRVTDEIHRQLDELLRRFGGHGVKLTGHVLDGAAFEEINRLATELGSQMIIMGTHGRTGLTHLLLGSVAERVVRTSNIPVLTVRNTK